MNHWIGSDGGPFIILPAEAASNWGGLGRDYERACEVTESLETIRVGDRDAVVLGDDPVPTTIATTAGVGFLHGYSAPDKPTLRMFTRSIDLRSLPVVGETRGRFSSGEYLLFESTLLATEARADESERLLRLRLPFDSGRCVKYRAEDQSAGVTIFLTVFDDLSHRV